MENQVTNVSTRTTRDPADLDVLQATTLLREQKRSPSELLTACQQRISERNGGDPSFDGDAAAVNAWVRLYPDVAGQLADAAEQRLHRAASSTPLLCGIPIGLKDLYAVEGLPVTASSQMLVGNIAQRSSVAWQRLHRAGMVLVGHTHTHEFATGGTTDQVANPWALDHSAGGSSGGSAAALACGMIPAALGTDTCGSLRVPASLCGVSAIKPTHGLIPRTGIVPLAPTLDHPGPITRSLADCSLLLTALTAGGAESTPLMPPPVPFEGIPIQATEPTDPLAGVTIAFTDRPDRIGVAPDIADGLEQARRACENLGARVVEIPAAGDLSGADFSTVLLSETAVSHAQHAGRDADYRVSTRQFVEQSRAYTAVDSYLRAQDRRTQITVEWEEWFSEHDVDVICEPTATTTAPLRGTGYDAGHLGGQGDPLIQLTATWNVTGFPSATLPTGLGRRTGLPVGVSLIGVRGNDARVLRTGMRLQQHALPPLGIANPL